jgi:hypothetical protein
VSNWPLFTLDQLVDVIDPHPSHRAPDVVVTGIPFVGIGDFSQDGSLSFSKARRVDPSVFGEHEVRYDLKDRLLAIGRVASIGKVAELPWTDDPYVVSPTLAVLRRTGDRVINRYLFWVLQSRFVVDQLNGLAKGSTRRSVGIVDLRKVLIPIPPLDEQKRIVAKLDAVDESFRGLRAIAARKVSQLDSIETAMALATIRERELLEDWQFVRLGEVVETITPTAKLPRSSYAKVGAFPVISQESEFVNGWCSDEEMVIHVPDPVVIFGDHTRILKYVDVPFVAGADGVKILSAGPKLLPRFLFHWCRLHPVQSLGYARHFRLLKAMLIPVPSLQVQQELCDAFDLQMSMIDELRESAVRRSSPVQELESMIARQILEGAA